jgi:predicted enzyme related to lactoylglutathione lyase
MTLSIKPNLHIVYVTDVEVSTHFYKTLFKTDPIFTSPRYVVFSAGGGVEFALWSGAETPDSTTPRFSEIGIQLPTDKDVEDLFKEWLEIKDIKFSREIYSEVFGRTFLVEDPDGHMIRVCSED